MKKILVISSFLLLSLSSFPLFANHEETQKQALEAYQKGEYQYASELYQQMLSEGLHAFELYYNLGNAYFKQNEIAKSILYFEKALKLKPNDANTQYNLKVAQRKTIDKIEPLPELFIYRWWRNLINWQSAGSWAGITIFIWILFWVSVGVYLASRTIGIKKTSFGLAFAFLLLGLMAFSLAWKGNQQLNSKNTAVIMAQRITAKSAPNPGSTDLFVIHEGTKIFISDKMGEWVEIRLANGSVGWIKSNTFELI
jgi:tetratricopeptide (TPR) repeat protein